ncbi:MAG TPA: hypothetical protein VL221_06970 [Bacteroidota bacterium]|nr:hypothetical protein [Bacteroidota bacterium]
MRIEQLVRFAIMILAGAVALAGILVMTGVLSNPAITGQFRIAMGAAIFLYGVYRFTVAWFRRPERRDP